MAVAAAAAQRQRELTAGLLLITPWDRLADVVRHWQPPLAPAGALRIGAPLQPILQQMKENLRAKRYA